METNTWPKQTIIPSSQTSFIPHICRQHEMTLRTRYDLLHMLVNSETYSGHVNLLSSTAGHSSSNSELRHFFTRLEI